MNYEDNEIVGSALAKIAELRELREQLLKGPESGTRKIQALVSMLE